MAPPMTRTSGSVPELIAAIDAFLQEHRRCGALESGADGQLVWIVCECGARLVRPAPDDTR